MIDYEGTNRQVTKNSDPELFHALLGGSPGNLGVVTHFTLKVHLDRDYAGSYGFKSLYWYTPETLNRLTDIAVEMAEDEDLPRNYDYIINITSSSNELHQFHPVIEEQSRREHPELWGENDSRGPRMITVYAQWVPFSPDDKPDLAWFERIAQDNVYNLSAVQKPMSELCQDWLFRHEREFFKPFVKCTRSTNSRTLSTDGFARFFTERCDAVMKPQQNRCWLSAQIQVQGGKNSKHLRNADNGTSYSWRDSTMIIAFDVFHDPDRRDAAVEYQRALTAGSLGPKGKFSTHDRRPLWGSFGSFDLHKNWSYYYDSRDKYERIGRVRARMDPEGTLTPNTFCAQRVLPDTPKVSAIQTQLPQLQQAIRQLRPRPARPAAPARSPSTTRRTIAGALLRYGKQAAGARPSGILKAGTTSMAGRRPRRFRASA